MPDGGRFYYFDTVTLSNFALARRFDLLTGRYGGRLHITPEVLGEIMDGIAAGYSACFLGALKAVADKQKVKLPDDRSIDAEVDIGPTSHGFGIAVRMTVHLPGMERAQAQALVDAAHQVCPYSNATRGNIPVELTLA